MLRNVVFDFTLAKCVFLINKHVFYTRTFLIMIYFYFATLTTHIINPVGAQQPKLPIFIGF